jgi:hypothetical protein
MSTLCAEDKKLNTYSADQKNKVPSDVINVDIFSLFIRLYHNPEKYYEIAQFVATF